MHFNQNEAREIVMKHYMNPENKKNLNEATDTQSFFSTSCADKLVLKRKWKGDLLDEVSFDGHGCAIFLASTDIFLNLIKNKNKDEIARIKEIYTKFVKQENLTEEEISSLGELWVFFNVKTHLNRVNCALLISESILK
ncbi:iron-sulfur cluster assembly scaffold protein [Mycoplasmopsis glycophila]|uniref:Nitrogen fixation protein NIFU n=1 Tax=Mycoplasmopsis glycophila TaxID=171285 RepID=A0A449AUM0_9BACT|nr:iron-sulfur cluster assembly scaffold protein [Mycoplasmopsis glycophila]VEU70219.1 nitrogen fixation protein NIFU [Mycoplasmopsis glycophila]